MTEDLSVPTGHNLRKCGGRVSRDDWAEVLVGGVVVRVVVGHEGVVVVEMLVVVGHEGVWRIMAVPLPV